MSILLFRFFRTIICEGSEDITDTRMRTSLELAQILGMPQAALQLAVVQETLCTRLFHEPNPDRINFPLVPLKFLRSEMFPSASHPLDAFFVFQRCCWMGFVGRAVRCGVGGAFGYVRLECAQRVPLAHFL